DLAQHLAEDLLVIDDQDSLRRWHGADTRSVPREQGDGIDSDLVSILKIGAIAASILLLGGCRRGPAQPSPEYEEARARWMKAVARAVDAYAAPEMDSVLGLLDRVSPDS